MHSNFKWIIVGWVFCGAGWIFESCEMYGPALLVFTGALACFLHTALDTFFEKDEQ